MSEGSPAAVKTTGPLAWVAAEDVFAPCKSLLVNPVDEAFFFQFDDETIVDNLTELERRAGFARQGLFDLNLHSFPGRQRHASGIGRKPTARNFHLLRILKTSK